VSTLHEARERMRTLYGEFPAVARGHVIDHWLKAATPDERNATLRYGAERIYGEVERTRSGVARLRAGERAVNAQGIQLSIPLLAMSFPQARASAAGKKEHALGEMEEALFQERVIAIAEERCCDRGLDPDVTDFVIGAFIAEDEIAEMRRTKAA
jgi:hypothetical protein